ncbi:MAG: prolipoprotein diacylglyceryl transferase [bacterium]|nr:prolipoprotein diacylglyceryl transferase [bacterium]
MNPVRIVIIAALVIFLPVFIVFYVIPAFGGEIDLLPGFQAGPVYIRFYGLLMAAAVLVGFFVASRYAPRFGIEKKHIEGALLWIAVLGFIGARLYYVIFSWAEFQNDPLDILIVWKGGLSIYGGIIGAAAGIIMYAIRSRMPVLPFLDVFALGLPLAQSIGRWGNFFNQEAFGAPTTLPWGIYIEPQFRPFEYLFAQSFHPAFLYESVLNLFIFFLLVYLVRTGISMSAGRLAGTYLILYPIGRYFIESLRLDSFFINSFRVDQITSLVMMLAGAIILFISYHAQKSKQIAQIN